MTRGEFYVGWQEDSAPGLAARARRTWLVLLGLGLVTAALLTADQVPFAPAVFEFGNPRTFRGTLHERPVPLLEVARPGGDGASLYPLVAEYKWGAADLVAGRDGERVELAGTLIHRDDRVMIEVVADSVRTLEGEPAAPVEVTDLGTLSLAGEIVDSKCYLGVMNPGHTKVHRACAVRCLSGGIPPVLMVTETSGRVTTLLLVDEDGDPLNEHVLPLVAEPVRVTGRVERFGDQLVMHAAPEAIERLAP